MLRNLRLFASSFVGGLFIILLAVPFLFTDMSQFGGGQGDPAVTVEDERIYNDTVISIANQVLLFNGRNLTGNPTSIEEARSLPGWTRIENQILSNIVVNQVLEAELENQRWTASVEEIIALMPEDPSFQVLGQYEPLQAELALSTPQAEQAYIKQRRIQLNADRLKSFASQNAPLYVPSAAAQSQLDFLTRLYAFDTLTLLGTNEDVGQPSDTQLRAILTENPKNYRTQEYRTFSALIIDPNALARDNGFEAFIENKSDLTWEEYLAENPDIMTVALETAAERATLMQDTQQDGIDLNDDSFAVRDATINDLAEKTNLSIQRFQGVDRFGRTEDNDVLEFARKYEKFLDDLFLLEDVNELSEVRVLDNGVAFAIQLDSIIEARSMTFEEARKRLVSFWRHNKQKEALKEKVDRYLEDLKTEKLSLQTLAAQEGAKVVEGELMSLTNLAGLGIRPAQAFGMTVGEFGHTALGSLSMIYQLRKTSQQTDQEADFSLQEVRQQIGDAFAQPLDQAFHQGIENKSQIKINQREWDAALDQAILTANNAGYFDGTATEQSIRDAYNSLQNQGQ